MRPAIRAALRRWGEALAGAALVALGLRWLGGGGILAWVGGAVAALGAAVAFTGVQRARFGRGGEGPGLVRVDEGRVLYMGPESGGAADLDALRRVVLEPARGASGAVWVLEGQGVLRVPAGALGAAALLDAFAALPGFEVSRALAALGRPEGVPVTLWRAPGTAPAVSGPSDPGPSDPGPSDPGPSDPGPSGLSSPGAAGPSRLSAHEPPPPPPH